MAGSGRWLIVGLGNPGAEYAATRHNAGYLVAEELARRVGGRFKAHKGRALVCETHIGGQQVVLAQPLSFMNESGGPVSSVAAFFKIGLDTMIAVHDELDIDFGRIKVKRGGGDGGHNGVKSLRQSLGSGEFLRVRVGIGRPPGRMDPAAFVLKPFSPPERKELPYEIDRAADAVEALLTQDLAAVQNIFHD